MTSSALRHKISALLEPVSTRLLDAGVVLLLLRALVPEDLGLIERSQSIALPMMFLFPSTDLLLFKMFSKWKSEGPGAHLARVRSLRYFCWLKGLAGIALAVAFSITAKGLNPVALCTFLWAFSRCLAPQIVGADREYLRLSGHVPKAFLVAFAQKALFFVGVVVATHVFSSNLLAAIAVAGMVASIASGFFAFLLSRRVDALTPGHEKAASSPLALSAVVREAIVPYSFWTHIIYVISTTTESLDVLALVTLGFAREIVGIYGAAVRVSNFSLAVPAAISLWLGMRLSQSGDDSHRHRSMRAIIQPTLLILGISVIQLAGLIFLGPYIAQFLGPRWADADRARFLAYLTPLAIAASFYNLSAVLLVWLKLCRSIHALALAVFVPWFLGTGTLYFKMAAHGDALRVAWSNIACYSGFTALLLFFVAISKPESARNPGAAPPV